MKLYGEISKSEDQEDGTVKVWGYASTASVDSQGEIVTADAMRDALPDYMKFANVREMHTAKAAGIAIEAEVQDDGRTFFGAHVIDSEAVKKVRAGVYKGFSIGGKVLSRDSVNKTTITALRLSEVSLVDRPANPEATFTFFKADGIDDAPSEEADDTAKADQSDAVAKADEAPAPETEDVTLKLSKAHADFVKGLDAAGIERMQKFMADEVKTKRDSLLKGMGHVGRLAYLLKEMQWLVADQVDEAVRENDNSPVPARLQASLIELGSILMTMTQEEVGELATRVGGLDAMPDANSGDLIASAAGTDDLAKAGAKFSSATKGTLSKAHEAMKNACTHLDGLDYSDSGISTKADASDDLAKLSDDLAKLASERDTLAKRVKELEATPAAAPGALKVVDKSQDYTDPLTKTDAKEDKPKTPEDIMKSIHLNPMVMSANGLRNLT